MENPKGYYTSRYSGEEIDRLLSGIPPGGAADKSVQDTVEATRVPSRTAEVTAMDLPGYIMGLPKLLTEDLIIAVSAGTIPTTVAINSFYGPGRLTITAQDNAEVNFSGISAYYNNIIVQLNRLKFQKAGGSLLDVYESDLRLENCDFLGIGGSPFGLSAYLMCAIALDSCTFRYLDTAIFSGETSIISATNCAAAENGNGAYVWRGGIVLLAGTTPELMGGVANKKAGGLIVKSDGTLL